MSWPGDWQKANRPCQFAFYVAWRVLLTCARHLLTGFPA